MVENTTILKISLLAHRSPEYGEPHLPEFIKEAIRVPIIDQKRAGAHNMYCPHCIEELKLAERKGIEIDYCPNCRGVWLDRGELDKIIDRSIEAYAPSPSADREEFTPRDSGGKTQKSKKSKKAKIYRSVLEELFDF